MTLLLLLAFVVWQVKDSLLLGFAVVGIIGASVLLHELGHALVSRRFGTEPDCIVLWPLGGLAVGASSPGRPMAEVAIYAAGPAVNIVLAALAGVGLAIVYLVPPASAIGVYFEAVCSYGLWINGMLVIFNLLPAFPLDGGGILRGLLWARSGNKTEATLRSIRIARVVLIVVGVAGFLWLKSIFLIFIILYLLYEGWKTEQQIRAGQSFEDGGFMGYDFSRGYTSLERSAPAARKQPGVFARWRNRRKAIRAAEEIMDEVDIRERVDALLDRIGKHGIESLTREERRILDDASRRYKADSSR